MRAKIEIAEMELILFLSGTVEMISPELTHHHTETAFLALELARELGLPPERRHVLMVAAMLHDVGLLTLEESRHAVVFDSDHRFPHSLLGARLLGMHEPFRESAEIIRHHHVYWNDGQGAEHRGRPVPSESHILHLADRASVLVDRSREILGQASGIVARLEAGAGRMFRPEVVAAFRKLAEREAFWCDLTSPRLGELLIARSLPGRRIDELDELLHFARLCSQVLDFRSRFTATHSAGVAAVSSEMARLAGFSPEDCRLMALAGYLHDLGKLAIPNEILEKPERLTPEEFNIVRKHTWQLYRMLERSPGLEQVAQWAAYHHERLDGGGYPFRLKGEALPPGSRLLAVADIFTALTEERPYRAGISPLLTLELLRKMVAANQVDGGMVELLARNFQELDAARVRAQQQERRRYQGFLELVGSDGRTAGVA